MKQATAPAEPVTMKRKFCESCRAITDHKLVQFTWKRFWVCTANAHKGDL